MKQNLIFLTILLTALSAFCAEYYVDATRPDDSGAATNWTTAKKTIQAAVDLTANGDAVWVTNGVYDSGGKVTPGYSLTNRVCITNAITVQSMNGAAVTVIKGAAGLNGGQDANSVRGVLMHRGTLSGFTVTNGYTKPTGNGRDCAGGGIWLMTNCVVSNCVISGNTASYPGGGGVYLHYGGTLNNCVLTGNKLTFFSSDGGGANLLGGGTLNNCTLSGNSASDDGGGAYLENRGTLNNCIVWGNTSASVGNDVYQTGNNNVIRSTCASDGIMHGTGDCITNNPLFADIANGNFQLQMESPCINVGNNTYAPAGVDLTGNPRITGGKVDMGAYEVSSALPAYSITTIAGTNGSITPENPTVFQGYDRTLYITPIPVGYHIDSMAVDGVSVPVSSSYTFMNVQEEHTIAATFAVTFYGLTVKSGSGDGSYTNGTVVQVSADVMPNGYVFSGWTTDPVAYTNQLKDASAASTTFTMPTTDVTLTATYMAGITTIAGANGSIRPENPMVPLGHDQILSFHPAAGYHIDLLMADDVPVPVASSYTFTNVQSPHTITATFTENADTFYVDAARQDDSSDGTTWATAKKTIQSAVDMVANGGTVWVTNGVYDIGGAVTSGYLLTNRICITRGITVRSVNGYEVTTIKGSAGSNGGKDVNSVRGVYMTSNCSLIGFTVTNGYTMESGNTDFDCSGGGIWLATNCVVSNCIVNGNCSANAGGGAYLKDGGTLNNCMLNGNSAENGGGVWLSGGVVNDCTMSGNFATRWNGGGAYATARGVLNRCVINGNSAVYGGGAYLSSSSALNNCMISGNSVSQDGGGTTVLDYSTLTECTISRNQSGRWGGGVYLTLAGTLNNCVVWSNTAPIGRDVENKTGITVTGALPNTIRFTCASSGLTNGVDGCITNNPLFVDGVNSNFHLQAGSPCINAGHNSYVSATNDLDGNPRIVGGVADMGAYERQDASLDFDADGMDDLWEMENFSSRYSANPNTVCSNGVNTLLEAYVAGLDPKDPHSKFLMSVRQSSPPAVLEWNANSGRVYSVYFSTNLLNGFQSLETNITAGVYTDLVHSAGQGFYRIDVRKP